MPERAIVSVIGPNGAGKTTFFNMLTGPLHADLRVVRFQGQRDHPRPARPDHSAMGIARTFQNIRLFPTMTTLENVLIGRHARMKTGASARSSAPPHVRREEAEARDAGPRGARATSALTERHFDAAGDQPLLRRSAPGRDRPGAGLASPRLLLLDEPTAGMNPSESAALTAFIRKLRDERGLTILLIEHDMKVVMDVSERITVLDHGDEDRRGHARRRSAATSG